MYSRVMAKHRKIIIGDIVVVDTPYRQHVLRVVTIEGDRFEGIAQQESGDYIAPYVDAPEAGQRVVFSEQHIVRVVQRA